MRWLSVPVINPIHADAAYVSPRHNDRPENCLKTSFAEAMVPQHSQCIQRLCTLLANQTITAKRVSRKMADCPSYY